MPHDLFPDNAFPPARNAPCYCGSGRRFKHCCGQHTADRVPPHGIGIVEDFLSLDDCRDFLDLADSMAGHRFTAFDDAGRRILDPHRATEWVDFRSSGQERLDDLVYRAFAEHVVPVTGLGIEWFEQPEVLRYGPGDYYLHHSDAYYLLPEKRAWRKAVDRDISLLIYFNDDYEGGELDFKRLSYRLRPRAGMLIWFPSDVRYEHMAMPVQSGRRYCLASWAAVTGVERVQSERAKRAIAWSTHQPKDATGRRVD